MYKRAIALVGIFLGTLVPAVAQTPAPRILPARVEPTMTMFRTASSDSFLLPRDFRKSRAYFSRLFGGAYDGDQSPERLLPTEELKTVLFTESSLSLVQLWSRRLQLDAFQSTLYIHNVQPYPGGARSVHLAGLSLSFHFGRNALTGSPIRAWQCLPRIVGTVLN